MGLLNILTAGTYGVIESFNFDKSNKIVNFDLVVYSSKMKETMLFKRTFNLSFNAIDREVISVTKKQPSADDAEPNYYFVPVDATGIWAGKGPCFAQFLGSEICYLEAAENQIIYCKQDDKHYKINANGTLSREIRGTKKAWVQYFDYPVSTAANTNIVKQCYLFLKNSGIFPNAIDA